MRNETLALRQTEPSNIEVLKPKFNAAIVGPIGILRAAPKGDWVLIRQSPYRDPSRVQQDCIELGEALAEQFREDCEPTRFNLRIEDRKIFGRIP